MINVYPYPNYFKLIHTSCSNLLPRPLKRQIVARNQACMLHCHNYLNSKDKLTHSFFGYEPLTMNH
jgi:hypothetical protein